MSDIEVVAAQFVIVCVLHYEVTGAGGWQVPPHRSSCRGWTKFIFTWVCVCVLHRNQRADCPGRLLALLEPDVFSFSLELNWPATRFPLACDVNKASPCAPIRLSIQTGVRQPQTVEIWALPFLSDCLFKKRKRKKNNPNEWRYLEMKTDNDMQRYLQHTHKGNKIRKEKKEKEKSPLLWDLLLSVGNL